MNPKHFLFSFLGHLLLMLLLAITASALRPSLPPPPDAIRVSFGELPGPAARPPRNCPSRRRPPSPCRPSRRILPRRRPRRSRRRKSRSPNPSPNRPSPRPPSP